MQSTIEKTGDNLVKLTVTVESDAVDKACEAAYIKMRDRGDIPGFRKGKIPKGVFLTKYGKTVFLDAAIEDIVSDAYTLAVDENGLEPIDTPQVDIISSEVGKELVFSAVIEVAPEAVLGEYKGLEITTPSTEVAEAEIEQKIEYLREKHSELVNYEGEDAALGHHAVIDFEGFIDGEPFDGGKAEAYSLILGSSSFIPGFEEGLVGMKRDEEKDLTLKFPEDYHAEDFAGKDVLFKVKMIDLKEKKLADVDDDLAKMAGDYEDLAQLKASIRENLERAAENSVERQKRERVLARVVENASVTIPDKMIKVQVEKMVNEFASRLRAEGMEIGKYLEYTGTDIDSLREKLEPEAEKVVKTELVIKSLVKAEDLSVSEEELEKEISELASKYDKEPKELRAFLESQGTLSEYKRALAADKAFEFLIGQTVFVEGGEK